MDTSISQRTTQQFWIFNQNFMEFCRNKREFVRKSSNDLAPKPAPHFSLQLINKIQLSRFAHSIEHEQNERLSNEFMRCLVRMDGERDKHRRYRELSWVFYSNQYISLVWENKYSSCEVFSGRFLNENFWQLGQNWTWNCNARAAKMDSLKWKS